MYNTKLYKESRKENGFFSPSLFNKCERMLFHPKEGSNCAKSQKALAKQLYDPKQVVSL